MPVSCHQALVADEALNPAARKLARPAQSDAAGAAPLTHHNKPPSALYPLNYQASIRPIDNTSSFIRMKEDTARRMMLTNRWILFTTWA